MTELQTVIEKFGISEDSLVYRAIKNKTQYEILSEINQSAHTFQDSSGLYVVVHNEIVHLDYERVV